MAIRPFWLTIFLDFAPEEHGAGVAFWQQVTGYGLSASRGAAGEFATLVPANGDDHLRVQRLGEGPSGTHLDLHVPDLDSVLSHARDLGATLVARPGHAVLRSPGGYPFCLVSGMASTPAEPASWPDGHRSRVDQLTLDIPPVAFEREMTFWSALTGWTVRASGRSEFARLMTPAQLPARILLQRLDEGTGAVRGHLDLATDDRAAEVSRLRELGAVVADEGRRWTVMRPPAGPPLCVTDRHPETGLVPDAKRPQRGLRSAP